MKKNFTLLLFIVWGLQAWGQSDLNTLNIPQMRQIFHDNIVKSQKELLTSLGGNGKIFNATKDIDLNLQFTHSIVHTIDKLRYTVESKTGFTENDKYKWLRSINDMLAYFTLAIKQKNIDAASVTDYINAYKACMQLDSRDESILPVIEKNEIEIISLLLSNFAFRENTGYKASKDALIYKTCTRYPDNILNIISQNLQYEKADSFLAVSAYRNPEKFYDYAAAQNALAKKIKSVNEPLVKTIAQMASMPTGRVYFPFLDEIYRNKLSIDSIAKAGDDAYQYYRLLVSTEIKYAGRMKNGDTPFVKQVLTDKLRDKAVDFYIDEINALHDEKSDAVRFKILEALTPQQLYYLCVLGEEEIYTSSYLGVYKRIFERLQPGGADSLLASVNDDFYKKFIRMAAAYNKLSDLLQRMDKVFAENLMQRFVDGLDKNKTLEDAVDVADSYASITDSTIRKNMQTRVAYNLQKAKATTNKRATVIYDILNTIFQSGNNNDLIAGMPIYTMPAANLKNEQGRITMLQFFYGDKDGMNVFNAFINTFNNGNWRRTDKGEWIEVSSVKGTPITIYANKPLDELKDLDAQAQEHLLTYLDSMNIKPTVVIHRGHSYYVKQTIQQLPSSAKVVLLGSCGGYHSLNDVLHTCPDAHIIASKQVGTGVVNITLINAITETLRSGKDLNWPQIWKQLDTRFKGDVKEKFDDYVPPHKNLGAIFIMAYKKQILSP